MTQRIAGAHLLGAPGSPPVGVLADLGAASMEIAAQSFRSLANRSSASAQGGAKGRSDCRLWKQS